MTEPRLSAGLVIVRFDGNTPRYLLLRAYRYWDFPKGLVEAGEDPIEAAVREAREETGLASFTFPWGPVWQETEPYRGRRKLARYYLAESRTGQPRLPVSAELGRPEHHEWRWATYEDGRGLLVPRVAAILDWAHGYAASGPA